MASDLATAAIAIGGICVGGLTTYIATSRLDLHKYQRDRTAAREDQDRLETRISELEHILQNLKVIKKPKTDGHVRLGSTVKLKSATGQAKEFQVVGTMEADPLSGKISDESPIGEALLGKAVGDKVVIHNSPDTTYKIASIG